MRELRIEQSITERDTGSLHKYLNEIGKIPLLTIAQEIHLSRMIKRGDQAALKQLIRANLRFVVSVAKQYQHKGLSLGDLINEGNYGLIKACLKFDETKGFKFISFAVWWIRQAIMLAISQQTRTIRLPLNLINSISKINKTAAELEQELERFPTAQEISDKINMDEERVTTYFSKARKCISLDSVMNPETGSSLLDILTGNDVQPDHVLLLDSNAQAVGMMLKVLSKREEKVLCLYFGLAGHQLLSLDDIALSFNLSRERIRQLKDSGLRKLRVRLRRLPESSKNINI